MNLEVSGAVIAAARFSQDAAADCNVIEATPSRPGLNLTSFNDCT